MLLSFFVEDESSASGDAGDDTDTGVHDVAFK